MIMKLKVNVQSQRKQQDAEDKKPEQKIEFELKLTQDEDGDVVLQAVDMKGERIERGNILYVDSGGFLVLMAGVNPDLGFQLDDDGRVKLCKKGSPPGFAMFLKEILGK